MQRDLTELARKEFDLLVIGGGIYGAFVAWDAALRGLSVAMIEKGDFGHATSSNTLRVIHGGLRYLQYGNIPRMRRSIAERTAFMRIAPHLVHPLPFLIPTYGHWRESKALLSLALSLNELIGFDRNRLADPQKHLPRGRIISREECRRLVPGVPDKDLTGGLIYYDCQMYDSERLILAVARSAAQAGAVLANYVEATKFLRDGARVRGIAAKDRLSGNMFEIRAKFVVNTSGPWLDRVLTCLNGHSPSRKLVLSKAFNLLVRPQIVPNYAVGVRSRPSRNDGAALCNDGGHQWVFITPWRGRSLIGTAHLPYDADPDTCTVTEEEIGKFLETVNETYPSANLNRNDVQFVYAGLLPVVPNSGRTGAVRLVTRHRIHDHQRRDGIEALVSVIGVKFTEARYVAERTVDLVFRKFRRHVPKAVTAVTPVQGGQIEQFDDFLLHQIRQAPDGVPVEIMRPLVYRYGSGTSEMLKYLDEDIAGFKSIGGDDQPEEPSFRLLRAEVLHAIRAEMAQTLTDVVFRRTEVVPLGNQTDAWVDTCAAIMAAEMDWDPVRTKREVEEAKSHPRHQGL